MLEGDDFADQVRSGKRDSPRSSAGNKLSARVKEFCQEILTQEYWQNFWPSLREEWNSSFRSVVKVARKSDWQRISAHLTCYAVVITLGIVLPLYYLLGWAGQFTGGDTCLPDGQFSLGSYYSVWDVSGLFQITMGFGALSFSNAKLLDAVWDVFVGRGVQALLALIAYKVTTKSLAMSMEHHTIPIGTFEAVALQDSTLLACYKQVSSFLFIKTWQHQLRLLWIILSTLFIVAFPTLVGAMTGYAPVTDPFLQGEGGQLIPFTSYRQIRYIVHDAGRIGLESPLVLSNVPDDSVSNLSATDASRGDICATEENMPFEIMNESLSPSDWTSVDEKCQLIWHVREYVKEYGFLGLNDTTSTFNKSGAIYNLSAPALNIEAVSTPSYIVHFPAPYYRRLFDELTPERRWEDPRNGEYPFVFFETSKYTLAGTNTILTDEDVNQQGNCQQTAIYKWGFSFLLLFIVLMLFIVWILGTYFLWLDAYLHSRLDIVKRDMGLYRAALDISAVIQHDLDQDVDSMTPNSALKRRMKGGGNGARIGFQCLNSALPLYTRMMGVTAWRRAGGFARWTPRIIMAISAVLFILPMILALHWLVDQSTMAVLMSLFGFLLLVNILILGRGQRMALCRKSSQSDTSHHPLQSFEDGGSPSRSRTSVSEVTVSGTSNRQLDTRYMDQIPKTTTTTTTVEMI